MDPSLAKVVKYVSLQLLVLSSSLWQESERSGLDLGARVSQSPQVLTPANYDALIEHLVAVLSPPIRVQSTIPSLVKPVLMTAEPKVVVTPQVVETAVPVQAVPAAPAATTIHVNPPRMKRHVESSFLPAPLDFN